jgi:transposase
MFMIGKRYIDEFIIEAVKQVTDRGYSVVEAAELITVSNKALWRVDNV